MKSTTTPQADAIVSITSKTFDQLRDLARIRTFGLVGDARKQEAVRDGYLLALEEIEKSSTVSPL